ncbi:B3 domain-containing protein [Trema orientale]|uniref:B3 domain-containing protein n=1 Tax=Trema orientale TaxID=63057 RepID=A0A2P5FIS1_TREOI|nr:B3 domain-containing protein [Trema orientale]
MEDLFSDLHLLAEVSAFVWEIRRRANKSHSASRVSSTTTNLNKTSNPNSSFTAANFKKKPRTTMHRRPRPNICPLLEPSKTAPSPTSSLSSEETLKEREKESDPHHDDRDSVLLPFKKRKFDDISTIIIGKEELEKTKTKNYKKRKMTFTPRYRLFHKPQPQDLPIDFKGRIRALGGTDDFHFIIQKEIWPSDVSKNNNRFSIPEGQVGPPDEFLRQDEKERMKEREGGDGTKIKGLQVLLFTDNNILDDRNGNSTNNLSQYRLSLKQWKMGSNCPYNLVSGWFKVVEDNNIAQHDVVQLWSFRKQSQLCFALVKVDPSQVETMLIPSS